MILLGINGCTGRMGRLICLHMLSQDNMAITDAFEHQSNPLISEDLGLAIGIEPWGINISALEPKYKGKMSVIVEFNTPDGFRKTFTA